MEASNIPLRKWAFAICLELINLKDKTSMTLHRDAKVKQGTAWFMLHRIREGLATEKPRAFAGPVEADETDVGGKEANKHGSKRFKVGGGTGDKAAVAGVKDRETGTVAVKVVERIDKPTLTGIRNRSYG